MSEPGEPSEPLPEPVAATEVPDPVRCANCASPYKPNAAFCSACGQPRPLPAAPASELGFALKLYFAMLAANLANVLYVKYGGGEFRSVVLTTGAFTVIASAFAITRWQTIVPLYRTTGFGIGGLVAITLAAPVVLTLVLGYIAGLEHAFSLHFPDELASITSHGLAWTIGLVVVAAPLVEELVFRGLMFTALMRTFTVAESLIISSLAFALLHLAIPSLVTHLPLGLYLCWLRHRSGSIWPGVYAHALHNLGVVLLGMN